MNRRTFLGRTAMALPALTLIEDEEAQTIPEPAGPVIDFHTHLFGIGDGGTGCYFSDRQKGHLNYRLFLKLLGLDAEGRIDQDYVAVLVRQLRESSVDKAVLLAYDARYDQNGDFDDATDVHIPNEYLFKVVAEYPDLFLPCISINPQRRDAINHLDWCAEQGARVLKIHPPTQAVDPGLERFRPFYRRMAEHGIILMVHTGAEHAADIVGDEFSDPQRLLPALEEGCTVIAAHAGMGSFFDEAAVFEEFFQNLKGLIDRFPGLYADSSIMAHMYRWRNIPRILEEPGVLDRLVHASDWPFPSSAVVFWNRLSPLRMLELAAEPNLFERDFRIKQTLGLPAEVFTRGAGLLGLA